MSLEWTQDTPTTPGFYAVLLLNTAGRPSKYVAEVWDVTRDPDGSVYLSGAIAGNTSELYEVVCWYGPLVVPPHPGWGV